MFDRVNTAIYRALAEAGIELPFPQREIHHKLDPREAQQLARVLRRTSD